MKDLIQTETKKLNQNRKRRSVWNRIVSVMAAVVVFCTTYALILPAITLEKTTPKSPFLCEAAPHEHTEDCYDEDGELICGYADFFVHTHTDECYLDGELVCNLEEIEEHVHTRECYREIAESSAAAETAAEETTAEETIAEETTAGETAAEETGSEETTEAGTEADSAESESSSAAEETTDSETEADEAENESSASAEEDTGSETEADGAENESSASAEENTDSETEADDAETESSAAVEETEKETDEAESEEESEAEETAKEEAEAENEEEDRAAEEDAEVKKSTKEDRAARAKKTAKADRAAKVKETAKAEREDEAKETAKAEREDEAEETAKAEREDEAEETAKAEREDEEKETAKAEREDEAEEAAEAEREDEENETAKAEHEDESEESTESAESDNAKKEDFDDDDDDDDDDYGNEIDSEDVDLIDDMELEDSDDAESEEEDFDKTGLELICDKPEIRLHTHKASCFDAEGNLICGKLEIRRHQHTAKCLTPAAAHGKMTFAAENDVMLATASCWSDTLPGAVTMTIRTDDLDDAEEPGWNEYLSDLVESEQDSAVMNQRFRFCFEDEDGDEVVPEGAVSVSIQYKKPLGMKLPETAAMRTKTKTKASLFAKTARLATPADLAEDEAETENEDSTEPEISAMWLFAEQDPLGDSEIDEVPDYDLNTNQNGQVESLTFESELTKTYGLIMLMSVRADPFSVTTEEGLRTAIANGNELIQLGGDIEVSGATMQVPANKPIELDLSGHSIKMTGSNTLFQISNGAKLTVLDSTSEVEGFTKPGGKLYGNEATVTPNGRELKLTYYVTHSDIVDADVGSTVETLRRYEVTATGAIIANDKLVFNVNGGTLNLASGMIYGGKGRALELSGGTADLAGGYICGFEKTGGDNQFGGAVKASGGTLNLTGTVLAANKALNGGAIWASGSANVNISKNGVISGNTSTRNIEGYEGKVHNGGGGIYCSGDDDVTVTMSGGYLTNNIAEGKYYFDGGGGAMMTGNSQFSLTGGYVTGNTASGGGGLRTDFGNLAKIFMTGGFVSANEARATEGAGIAIDRDGYGEITAGHITNNQITKTGHWGGGGLFCADGSDLYLYSALITENNARGFGGGIAGCPTGHIYLYVTQGCAIYGNNDVIDGTPQFTTDGVKQVDKELCTEFFQQHEHKDYFCAQNSTVTGNMLGGDAANWVGTADYIPVKIESGDVQSAERIMGLESNPGEAAIATAQGAATVFINGNYSYTHGGGILCNGNLIVGEPIPLDVPAHLKILAKKSFIDGAGKPLSLEGNNFRFEINDETGKQVATAACDEVDGSITFEPEMVFKEAGKYVYTIREIVEEANLHPEIQYDPWKYQITVEVEKGTGENIDKNLITPRLIKKITIEKSKDGASWELVEVFVPHKDTDKPNQGTPGKANVVLELTGEKATFTNIKPDKVKITVVKKWEGTVGEDSVTVNLYQNDKLYEQKELNEANSWTWTWENLPTLDEHGEKYNYRVEEAALPGYDVSYDVSNDTKAVESYWVPVEAESLVTGEEYAIVSKNGRTALFVTDAHRDIGFTSLDTQSVTPGAGELIIGNKTYSSWYNAGVFETRSLFIARQERRNWKYGFVLKNKGTQEDTWLLLQDNNNNHLKGTTQTQYASFFKVSGNPNKLIGWDGYNYEKNPEPDGVQLFLQMESLIHL